MLGMKENIIKRLNKLLNKGEHEKKDVDVDADADLSKIRGVVQRILGSSE